MPGRLGAGELGATLAAYLFLRLVSDRVNMDQPRAPSIRFFLANGWESTNLKERNQTVRDQGTSDQLRVLKGHGFSRAVSRPKSTWALAPEGIHRGELNLFRGSLAIIS